MSRNYIELGPGPCMEEVAQVGDSDYPERSRVECAAFVEAIRKHLGREPEGARLSVRSFQHDMGTYREAVCYYDDDDQAAIDYAMKCERESPETWEAAGMQPPTLSGGRPR